jgi:uncharacterized protein with von Willebrand factor type A (vWA) domain
MKHDKTAGLRAAYKRGYSKGSEDGTTIFLTLAYSALVDEFGFDTEKLNRLRKRMDRYARHLAAEKIDIGTITNSLADQGVDFSKMSELEGLL